MKKKVKNFLFFLWSTVIVFVIYYFVSSGNSITYYGEKVQNYIAQFGMLGPFLYILLYMIRPLVFFPATIFTTISGFLFGPVGGVIFTIIGENLSANFAFLVGRYFGKDVVNHLGDKLIFFQKAKSKMQRNGFMFVLMMRLLYFPFDLVAYASGANNIRQRDFALGTFIGILPGLIAFVLLGASFTDPRNLALFFIFFILGLVISKLVKKYTNAGRALAEVDMGKK